MQEVKRSKSKISAEIFNMFNHDIFFLYMRERTTVKD